jgi:hypothetical protein
MILATLASAWGHQVILANGLARLSTMDDPSASTPGDAPEPMAAEITAEGIQADDAQEPFDESLAPGPEDACALTLGAQSAGPPFLLPPLVHVRHHTSFLPRLRRWRRWYFGQEYAVAFVAAMSCKA